MGSQQNRLSDSSGRPALRRASEQITDPSAVYDDAPAHTLLAKHAALSYPYTCKFGEAVLEIDEGVFCPTLTHASPLLLSAVDFRPAERMLDAFAGSGAFGINAALRGAQAVLFDTSPLAVQCASRNAKLNQVEQYVDVRAGDMRHCLQDGEQFDLIVANPPLLPGEPSDAITTAIYDPQLQATVDFIHLLPKHLAPQGRCYLLTSDVSDRFGLDIAQLCAQQGLVSGVSEKTDLSYESYRVHKITW